MGTYKYTPKLIRTVGIGKNFPRNITVKLYEATNGYIAIVQPQKGVNEGGFFVFKTLAASNKFLDDFNGVELDVGRLWG